MSVSKPALSLREKITRNRNAAVRYAVFNAAVVAAFSALTALLNLSVCVLAINALVIAVMSGACALNTYSAVKARAALRIYTSNPAAAYLAEIRYAFGA